MNDPTQAIELLAGSALADPSPETVLAFAEAIAAAEPRAWSGRIADAVALGLRSEAIDRQRLEPAARDVLCGRIPGLADAVARINPAEGEGPLDESVRDALVADPLLPLVLRHTVIRHPGWEEILRTVRRHLLRETAHGRAEPLLDLLLAFAAQGYAIEHAWWGSHEARAIRAVLEAGVADRVQREPVSAEISAAIAAIAMYMPAARIEAVPPLLESADWRSGPLAELIAAQVGAPLEAARLADTIAPLVGGHAPGSEESPWPRLVEVDRITRRDAVGALVLAIDAGTGVTPLRWAAAGADVTAVDPSSRSLGEACRRARSLGVRVVFRQGGAADLTVLQRRFAIIDTGPAPHRWIDPHGGLANAVALLAPGGILHLHGVTAPAREVLARAHDHFVERGSPTSRLGLRRARRSFLELPASHPARAIVEWPAFYSVTGFRELVAVPPPASTTLEALAETLERLGLVPIERHSPSTSWSFRAT